MDNFKIMYKILNGLEKSMDLEEFDSGIISHDHIGASYPRWCQCMRILFNDGYINGIKVLNNILGEVEIKNLNQIEITMKGLEYLQENSIMQKIHNTAKGIKESVPGL